MNQNFLNPLLQIRSEEEAQAGGVELYFLKVNLKQSLHSDNVISVRLSYNSTHSGCSELIDSLNLITLIDWS